ncbi:MAG: alpha/beta hydrolase family protein [Candidatus Hodarchaeales archaeon]|jgi:dipeptidyl aminopeptidase/acylaminoacyl peptidase
MSETIENKKYKPSIRDLMLIPYLGGPKVSPECTKVAYLKGLQDFEVNQFKINCYIYMIDSETTFQLTNSKNVRLIQWINDNTLSALRYTDKGAQIVVYDNLFGESFQVTNHPDGVIDYKPYKNGFVFLANNDSSNQSKREKLFGNFIHVEKEESNLALHYIDFNRVKQLKELSRSNQKIETTIKLSKLFKKPISIKSIFPSPENNSIFLNCTPKDDTVFESDISSYQISFNPQNTFELMNVDEKSIASIRKINLPKNAQIEAISPNGLKLLFSHKQGSKGYYQSDLWIYELKNDENLNSLNISLEDSEIITNDLDQRPLQINWIETGIYLSFWEESTRKLAKISEQGHVQKIDLKEFSIEQLYFVNDKGDLGLVGSTSKTLPEIYFGKLTDNGYEIKQLTNSETSNWDLGIVESIRWLSKDGTEIEGILHKPSDFDPNKKYPLLFCIHGGPAASSSKSPIEYGSMYVYPEIQLVNKGIIILKPNYRGSLGRGQSFLKLNVDNLGIGDQWDIESAIDFLSAEGFIDESKIGSMGWSQGGYIGSFLAFHSNRFKAVSAGAALSRWYTYYIGSDNYEDYNLSALPSENIELYDKTAPISGIKNANTPIMFQHGEKDQRVPVTSAVEMFRALKSKGVKTELFIYPGKGHGWIEPRESYALMVQNYQWFSHFLLGEELNLYKDDQGNTV